MSTFLKLLISCSLFLTFDIIAEEFYNENHFKIKNEYTEEFIFNKSGFVYFTHFGNNDWQENKANAAINLNLDYSYFRSSLQIGTEDKPIRRATIETSYPLLSKSYIILTAGRFPRLDSFFNNATDNPGTSGMAILPLAGYNYKFQTGTFVILDGGEIKGVAVMPNSDLLTLRVSKGRMYVDNEKDMNVYFFTKYQQGVDIVPMYNTYDTGVHYETENVHFFVSQTHYEAYTQVTINDKISNSIVNNYKNLNYNTKKIGLKLYNRQGWVQSEYIHGDTQLLTIKNKVSYEQEAKDYYVIVGFYLNEYYQLYGGRSFGKAIASDGKKEVKDSFIGLTRETGDYAISIDYHHGNGRAWAKFQSPITSWNTLVTSFTYRF